MKNEKLSQHSYILFFLFSLVDCASLIFFSARDNTLFFYVEKGEKSSSCVRSLILFFLLSHFSLEKMFFVAAPRLRSCWSFSERPLNGERDLKLHETILYF